MPLFDQDPATPQSWNLYSYVRNNPLRFSDPDGRTCVVNDDGSDETIDDGGETCEEVAADNATDDPETEVEESNPSFLATLFSPPVPRYVPNDKALGGNAQKVLAQAGRTTAPIAILADCAAESYLPFTTAAAGESVWQLGRDTVPKPFAAGGNPYTSQLSIGARSIFGSKGGGFPSVIRGANGALKISSTNFGGFIGRALGPLGRGIGIAGLAVGVYQTGACVARN